jgi:hypothetical protein
VLDLGSFLLLVSGPVPIGSFAGLSISSLFLPRPVVLAPFFGVDGSLSCCFLFLFSDAFVLLFVILFLFALFVLCCIVLFYVSDMRLEGISCDLFCGGSC